MNWGMLGIIFAYLVLALLLLVLLTRTRWGLTVKALAVVAVGLVGYSTVISYSPLIGWPTGIGLPKRFNLVGIHVDEPNKNTQTKGTIYLWLTDMEQQIGKNIPRAYKIPYSPALHNKLNEASKKLRKNLPQLGETEFVRNAVTGRPEVDLQFFDMPDPLFPEK
jgi:hypothetical protein